MKKGTGNLFNLFIEKKSKKLVYFIDN